MKNKNYKKGGEVIASGGFGCVFNPALICKGSKKREESKISKLMTIKHAEQEYKEINEIKKKLDNIKDYENYFLLDNITKCEIKSLTPSDLKNFDKKCKALPKNEINKKNINKKLDKIMAINIPNGGIPVDDYIYNNKSFAKIYELHSSLVNLLEKGIIPMNQKNIYHCDIKDSNVLVSEKNDIMKTRLIDWGLTTEYIPFKNSPFPKTWRNRPLQFNVPFSVIIFTDAFIEKYTDFIEENGKEIIKEEIHLKPFVINYLNFWMKERGKGHYQFINEVMYTLFHNSLTDLTTEAKVKLIETQTTMDYIVNYIVNVLMHFTKFREDGSLNLRNYLDNVFIKIVDIWGFIFVYYPLVELLGNNYLVLTEKELKLFNKLQYIFVNYLFEPRNEEIKMDMLYSDLKDLGKIINENVYKIKINNKTDNKKYTFSKSSKISKRERTQKTKKTLKKSSKQKSSISFKRISKKNIFEKPFLLHLK